MAYHSIGQLSGEDTRYISTSTRNNGESHWEVVVESSGDVWVRTYDSRLKSKMAWIGEVSHEEDIEEQNLHISRFLSEWLSDEALS